MTQYDVVGEYGVQGDEYISLVVEADTVGEARRKFKEIVSLTHPDKWEKIGMHNISAYPITVVEKTIVILGLIDSGSWIQLSRVLLLDNTTLDAATQAMNELSDTLRAAKFTIQLGTDKDSVNFDPSKFLATRCELRGF